MIFPLTGENRASRRVRIRWQYVVPIVVAMLASCAPAPTILPGTIEPINVPPHSSPIYSNKDNVILSLAHESAQNWNESTYIEINTSGVDANGASCDDHLASHFTAKTSEQNTNHITPFDVVVNSNGEEGLCSVKVRTRECIGNTCSEYQNVPFTVDVVFDTTPPQVDVDASAPPGTVRGSATDLSPIAGVSASYSGRDGNLATSNTDSGGGFSMTFVPEVGLKDVTLAVQDAAGNSTTTTITQDYQFNAGLTITSMQLDGKKVDLAQLSQSAGKPLQEGDLFVGMQLPEGVDPSSVTLSGEQGNWRSFGFKSTFTCDKITQESFDVAFSCIPPSKSGDTANLKFTFTDKYGYAFDMYYPQQAFFSQETRALTLGEMMLYITERAVAILAALSIVGLSGVALKNRRQYINAYESALPLTSDGRVNSAFQKVDETSFLTKAQKITLKAQIKAHVEAEKRARQEGENRELINKLYVFPYTYHDYADSSYVPHDKIVEAIDSLNRVLQLGIKTQQLQDVRNRFDSDVILEKFISALDRWVQLNFVGPAATSGNNWQVLEEKWGVDRAHVESVLQSLFILQTKQGYSALWSQLKKGGERSKQNLHTIGILFAYNHGLLFRNGKMRQEVYTSLITHNGIQIEDVISTLMKWGSIGIGEFIGAIRDTNERRRAETYFKNHFIKNKAL